MITTLKSKSVSPHRTLQTEAKIDKGENMKSDQIMYASGWVLWIVLVVALCGYVIFGNRKGFRVVATAMATILTVVMILIALDMRGFRLSEVKIWAWSPTDTLNEILPQRATVTSTVTLTVTVPQTPIPTPTVTKTVTQMPTDTNTVTPQVIHVAPTMTVAPTHTPVPPSPSPTKTPTASPSPTISQTSTPKQTPIFLNGNSAVTLNNEGTIVINETETTKVTFIVTGDDPVLGGWFRTCTTDGTLYQGDAVICSHDVESIIQLKTDVEYRFEGTQLHLSPLAG